MKEKGMSKGEFTSVAQANGGLENMINWECKDKDMLALSVKPFTGHITKWNVMNMGFIFRVEI